MARFDINAERSIRTLFYSLIAIEIALVLGDVIFNVENVLRLAPLRNIFNIAHESSVGSWFSVTQTWMCGLTAVLLWRVIPRSQPHRWRRIGWAATAFFFIYLAIDDGAKIHERVGSAARYIFQDPVVGETSRQIGFFPSYTWQLIFVPLFAVLGLLLLRFLFVELMALRQRLMVLASLSLMAIAVIADFFEGIQSEHPLNIFLRLSNSSGMDLGLLLHYSRTIEEFLEMLAITLLWIVFLRHLTSIAPKLEFHFTKAPE